VTSLGGIDASACAAGRPTVLFFADRWTRFADFAQRLNDLCGHSRPQMVIADGSVSRFMANYQLRAVSNADWPVDYYVGGPGCADLTQEAFTNITNQMYAQRTLLNVNGVFTCADRTGESRDGQLVQACTLDAAVKLLSQPCQPNDLGTFLAPAWDAVFLADALLPARPAAGKDYLTSLDLRAATLSTGAVATVRAGRLVDPTIAVRMWHVDPLDDASRVWERPSEGLLLPTDPVPGVGQAP
jgi:hypothetical protein